MYNKNSCAQKIKGMIQYPCGCSPKVLVYEGTFGYSAVQCPACKKYAMFDYEHMTARPMEPIKGLTHALQLHNGIYHWDIGVVGRPPLGRGRKEITALLTVICFLSRPFCFQGVDKRRFFVRIVRVWKFFWKTLNKTGCFFPYSERINFFCFFRQFRHFICFI